jgi:hypothetical protein
VSPDLDRFQLALVCRVGERTPKLTPSSSQGPAGCWSPPRTAESGSDASPILRQRPPRPLQAGRTRRACDRALGQKARLEFPASASGRRSAQPGGGAGSARAPGSDPWSREQSGPVARSPPLAADWFSFVPRCSSLNYTMASGRFAERSQVTAWMAGTAGPAGPAGQRAYSLRRTAPGVDVAGAGPVRLTPTPCWTRSR